MKAQYQLLILYALQGIIQTFFLMTLPLSLAQRGYSMTNLGFFGLLSFGFTLKVIFAPIVDLFYNKSLGKRRTYIILPSFLIGLFFLGLTIVGDSISIIGIAGFFICLLNGVQDLALDGISVTLKDPAMMQNIGLNIGSTLNIVYSILDLNDQLFYLIMGIIMIIVAVVAYIDIQENQTKVNIQSQQILDIGVKMIKQMNLRQLILLTLIERLPLCLLDSVFQFKIVQAGVPKSIMAIINSAVFPFKLLSAYVYSRFPEEWKSYSFYPRIQYARLLENIIVAFCLLSVQYEYITSYVSYVVIYFTTVVWYFDYNVAYIIRGNFFAKVTTPGIEVLTLTLLSTSFQLGVKMSKAMGMFICDHFDFNLLILLGLMSHFAFTWSTESRYKRLAALNKSEWEIQINKQK